MKISSLFLSCTVALSGFLIVPFTAFAAHQTVKLNISDVQPGTIVIRERERALYFVLDNRNAIRYPVAVPKSGMQWSGWARVQSMHSRPDWSPPAVVRRSNPSLPEVIPGGAPNNPMGAAAIVLDREEIAIHGTSAKMRSSIGTAASFGCIRMFNEDVLHLYSLVSTGTPVLMMR